jgi:dTDP-4-dehydrorhamnose reductase
MPRVTVIGHTGLVGGAIARHCERRGIGVLGVSRSARPPHVAMDITSTPLPQLVERSTSAVVLCAAYANVEACETNPEVSRAVNVEAPRRIAELCAHERLPLIFYSTDYIFNGEEGPYLEDASPGPISVYGRHKAEAERAIRRVLPEEHLIIRTTVVFGVERARKNFAVRLVDELRGGRRVRVPNDQIGTPTWSDDLADASLQLLFSGKRGTVHVAGSTLMNRYDFSVLAAKVFGLDSRLIEPVATCDFGQVAARPLQGGLRSDRLREWIGREMLGAEEGLRRFAADFGAET